MKHINPYSILYSIILQLSATLAIAGNPITATSTPAIAGCVDTFTYNVTASYYEWNFGPNAQPSSVSGSMYQHAATVFTQSGTQRVYVSAVTGSGLVTDSIDITISPNPINITLQASKDTVCTGTAITYTALPAGYMLYYFYVNNTLTQATSSNHFTPTTLSVGDSVYVYAYDGVCYSHASNAKHPAVIDVQPPTLTDSDVDDTICGGDVITFTATPTGYDTYQFYTNGALMQNGPLNTFTTYQLGQGNLVYVTATQAGCTSQWSNTEAIFIKPGSPLSILTNDPLCEGTPVEITAIPAWYNYNFYVNGQLVQSDSVAYYTSPNLQNGDTIKIQAINNNCSPSGDSIIILSISDTPAQPAISASGSILNASAASSYVWYFNSTPIDNSNTQIYTATQSGSYMVQVFNLAGCSSFSNTVVVQVSGIDEHTAGPVFVATYTGSNALQIQADRLLIGQPLFIYDITGRLVFSGTIHATSFSVAYKETANGLYLIKAGTYTQKIVTK